MKLPNTLDLNVSDLKYEGQELYKTGVTNAVVGDKDLPIYIHLESDTDWATFVPAVAGVVVALLVAWFTIGVQKTQIQGGISNFRHHWMTELRDAASELIVTLRLLANGGYKKEDFDESDAYWQYGTTAMQMHSKVSLLLSRDDPFSDALRIEGGALVQRVMRVEFEDAEFDLLLTEINSYQDALRAELEDAWADAKSDLGFNRKFLLFRLFEKEAAGAKRIPYKRSNLIKWDDHT